jgi:hypothetical protein
MPCSLVNMAHIPNIMVTTRYSVVRLMMCLWYTSRDKVKNSEAPTSARPVDRHLALTEEWRQRIVVVVSFTCKIKIIHFNC